MDDDVTEHRPEWTGEPADWYSAIPAYPRWIAVDSTFTGVRGQLRLPTYYTRYRDRDYACGQRVAWEIPSAIQRVDMYALNRIPVAEPYPGWEWSSVLSETCPDERSPTECLADLRRRLPVIVESAETTDQGSTSN
jgi:hypothetical protein